MTDPALPPPHGFDRRDAATLGGISQPGVPCAGHSATVAVTMRPFVLILLLLPLAACTESSASRVDERTFRIEGPPCTSCGEGPNRRLANRVCPKGYYVVDQRTQKGGADRVIDQPEEMTIWMIRCI